MRGDVWGVGSYAVLVMGYMGTLDPPTCLLVHGVAWWLPALLGAWGGVC